jgi:predicted ferric reductase
VVAWRSEHQNTFPKGINTILSPHKSTFEALLLCIRHGLGLTLRKWEQARATLPAAVKGSSPFTSTAIMSYMGPHMGVSGAE